MLCYVCAPSLIFVPVEGDDIALVAGGAYLRQAGKLEHGFGYRYDSQPAVYWLGAGLSRVLNLPVLTVLSASTVVAFSIYLIAGGIWIQKLAGVSFPVATLLLLAFQEVWVSAYYVNSSILAGAFLAAALAFGCERGNLFLTFTPRKEKPRDRPRNSGLPVGEGTRLEFAESFPDVAGSFPHVMKDSLPGDGRADKAPLKPPGNKTHESGEHVGNASIASASALAHRVESAALGEGPKPGSSSSGAGLVGVTVPGKIHQARPNNWGFWLRPAVTGVLSAAAALFRFDAVLLSPAVLANLFMGTSLRWGKIPIFGMSFLGSYALASYLGDVSFIEITHHGSSHVLHFSSPWQTILSWATLASLPIWGLAYVGLLRGIRSREFFSLGVTALGVLPLIAAYGLAWTTPRYFLYGILFVALCAACGLQSVYSMPNRWKVTFSGTIIIVLFFQYGPGPLTFLSWISGRNYVVAGTHDGIRRLDGIAFLPVQWYEVKLRYCRSLQQGQTALDHAISRERNLLILTDDWFSSKWVAHQLLQWGYRCGESHRHFAAIPIADQCDFRVFQLATDGGKRASEVRTFEVQWLTYAAEADWRKNVDLYAGWPIILVSGFRSDTPSASDLPSKLGLPAFFKPFPGFEKSERIWIYEAVPKAR